MRAAPALLSMSLKPPPLAAESPALPAPLGDRIAQRIRDRIVEGGFAPGQRLSETALAEELGISRNTLREVFRTLAKEGLVTHARNRGVSVAVPSFGSIVDIYRVRRMIECQALGQATARHPAGAAMRAAVQGATASLARTDWIAVGTANMAFHRAIVGLADSERLDAMFAGLLVELRLAFGLLDDAEYLHAPYVPLNRGILELFEADRFADAAAALAAYLDRSERAVLAVYGRRFGETWSAG